MESYEEILNEIHQIPRQKKEPNLKKMQRLMALLNHPEEELSLVHVAGTNGKGSICKMIEEVLIKSGYQVGLFTSPYIIDFRERIQINGQLISKKDLVLCYKEVKSQIPKLLDEGFSLPTEFEVVTAMGLLHFKNQNVDVGIIEVGIGGLYDATNVIQPILSVIASITKDHTSLLGHSIESIAQHKAGIMKGNPVVSTSQLPEARRVLLEKARQVHSEILFLHSKQVQYVGFSQGKQHIYYDFEDNPIEISLSLLGIHQMLNGGTAILALRKLMALGFSNITQQVIKRSLPEVRWPGRMEILLDEPLVMVDGAHNLDGAISLKESLELYYPGRKVILIIGMLKDKEPKPLLEVLMSKTKKTFFITPKDPRALKATDLKSLSPSGEASEALESMEEAVRRAMELYEPHDLILSAGSLYTIGQFKGILASYSVN